MKILITGAGGFVGRKLVQALAAEHDIVAIDRSCAGLDGAAVRIFEGDFADRELLDAAVAGRCDALVHLATMPGGAAEQDPIEAFRVNVQASATLLDRVSVNGSRPRVVFASSIAVFGEPLPALVDDDTPLRPRMVYGAHKAMLEQWIATLSRRGTIRGLSLRLPGIIARPKGPSGMKSAFMSDIFHAAAAGERFTSPVSAEATMWLMSVSRLAGNIVHALNLPDDAIAGDFALTLPAVRTTMGQLAGEISRQTGASPGLVDYAPDAALEAGFGSQPPLETPAADGTGFRSDGSLEALVASALGTIREHRA